MVRGSSRRLQEEELKQTAETRLQEVLASIDAAVQSGATARGSSGAKSELYGRLSTAIEAIQEGLIERDVEVWHVFRFILDLFGCYDTALPQICARSEQPEDVQSLLLYHRPVLCCLRLSAANTSFLLGRRAQQRASSAAASAACTMDHSLSAC